MSGSVPLPTDRLYATICELWPQYAAQPKSDVTREFLRRYPPTTTSYREVLLRLRGVPDPLQLFDSSK